jgi:hypothetical protein
MINEEQLRGLIDSKTKADYFAEQMETYIPFITRYATHEPFIYIGEDYVRVYFLRAGFKELEFMFDAEETLMLEWWRNESPAQRKSLARNPDETEVKEAFSWLYQ